MLWGREGTAWVRLRVPDITPRQIFQVGVCLAQKRDFSSSSTKVDVVVIMLDQRVNTARITKDCSRTSVRGVSIGDPRGPAIACGEQGGCNMRACK